MNSTSMSCGEDRVALARRGALSPEEWQDFATHLAECVDCRVAWRLGMDFEHGAPARPGDERIVSRGVKAALASSARRRPNLIRLALAASVVLVAASAASAALLLHVRHSGQAESQPTPSKIRPAKSRAARNAAAAPQVQTVPAESPAGPAVELPAALPAPSQASAPAAPATTAPASPKVERVSARPSPEVATLDPFEHAGSPLSPPPAPPPREDAPGLFARALAERQEGRGQTAIATFRRLEREFPDSREATVSLVSLGDLLLGTRQEAEALLCFEAYLHRAPTGALVPEAWIGKARALDALGRVTEARVAWKEIARRFPNAPYLR